MKRCVHCAEEIQDAAAVCRHCGRNVPAGATEITQRGGRYGVGTTEDRYAVWDLTTGGPAVETFEKNDQGWNLAWSRYRALEGFGHPTAAAQVLRPAPTNGMAIASLVLGIVWLWGIGSILALIFGFLGKGQIDLSGGVQQGRGLAIAGIVLGFVGLGLVLIYILVVAAAYSSF